ncbi:TetR/AcrR family transcriptional regulator [Nitriliruptor alkaliphilus]|uniref:TetR/AcrR family transcriptional regulator n=1 Tax=Nitriliruptor alkaliphilus TaxID=427918 RepID=UPI0014702352|nr:TetR/AcrR family transcriptional regulator [Nitriliruptor alkaliphilus]
MRTGDLSDPRAQRTRALLLAEYERQLALGGEPPTVASLVREAGVSRSAFYGHFTSIDEVGVAAVRSALDQLGVRDTEMRRDDAASGVSVARMTYAAFFAHILGHRHLYAPLIGANDISAAHDELREVLIAQTQRSIEAIADRPDGVDSRRAARFIIGGLMAVMAEWLRDPQPCSPQELAEHIAQTLPTWFASTNTSAPTVQVDVLAEQEDVRLTNSPEDRR